MVGLLVLWFAHVPFWRRQAPDALRHGRFGPEGLLCCVFVAALIVVFGVVMVGSTGIVVRAISLLSSTGP